MPLDYKNTDDADLHFENGDLVVAESTSQHQKDILLARKGDYRESPDVGVGIRDWMEDDALGDLPAAIQEEYEKDGMKVTSIKITASGKADINADY